MVTHKRVHFRQKKELCGAPQSFCTLGNCLCHLCHWPALFAHQQISYHMQAKHFVSYICQSHFFRINTTSFVFIWRIIYTHFHETGLSNQSVDMHHPVVKDRWFIWVGCFNSYYVYCDAFMINKMLFMLHLLFAHMNFILFMNVRVIIRPLFVGHVLFLDLKKCVRPGFLNRISKFGFCSIHYVRFFVLITCAGLFS